MLRPTTQLCSQPAGAAGSTRVSEFVELQVDGSWMVLGRRLAELSLPVLRVYEAGITKDDTKPLIQENH